MTIYYALIGALLVLHVVGVLPLITTGAADRNNIFRVQLRPRTDPKYLAQPYLAVRGQEIVEELLHWLVAIALNIVPAWLMRELPAAPALQILSLLILTFWSRIPPLTRQLEFVGHAAEIEVAERMGLTGYAMAEAKRTRTEYGSLFLGLTVEELAAAYERRRPVARVLLAVMKRRIGSAAQG